LKQSIFTVIAIFSIAASSTAEAKPRQNLAGLATITCNERGCSDHRSSMHPSAEVRPAKARSRVHTALRARAGSKRTASVRHNPRVAQAGTELRLRSDVRHVRAGREGASVGVIVCNQQGCSDRQFAARTQVAEVRAAVTRYRSDPNGNDVTVIGGRPAGCPHAFCGCEASRYVFGEMRPDLYLATNWMRKFPRAMPAPGMAAVRSGHVMVLISHVEGNDWLVHDGNSGGGLTRRHVRSISGHAIVDPQGSRTAQRYNDRGSP
jgi:hypothetical protein